MEQLIQIGNVETGVLILVCIAVVYIMSFVIKYFIIALISLAGGSTVMKETEAIMVRNGRPDGSLLTSEIDWIIPMYDPVTGKKIRYNKENLISISAGDQLRQFYYHDGHLVPGFPDDDKEAESYFESRPVRRELLMKILKIDPIEYRKRCQEENKVYKIVS